MKFVFEDANFHKMLICSLSLFDGYLIESCENVAGARKSGNSYLMVI